MRKVFCFEGINNRIWEIENIFTPEMMELFKEYCIIASKMLGADFYEELQMGKSKDAFHNAYVELVVTYICNCVIFEQYVNHGIKPDALAGFSLGLNTAMVCSGRISFESGLKILLVNRYCMEYISTKKDYGLALIAGLPTDVVMWILEKNNLLEQIKIAGEVSDYCTLITGEASAIQSIEDECREEGAMRFNKINSFIPFHFGLHDKVIDSKIETLNSLPVSEGIYPVFSVYTLNFLEKKNEVLEELKKNIYTPMQWKEAILLLEKMEYHEFWDVSLTASNKKITSLQEADSVFHTFKQFKKHCLSAT